MKILEKEFRSKGFFHKQIFREGEWAIYKRWRVLSGTDSFHFEVIKIVEHDEYKLGTAIIPAGQAYPGSSQWGLLGWTLKTKEEAFKKLEQVREHQKQLELATKKRKK